ncbi:polypeptide-transport-associated, ShlB-type domain protein [Burkholderia pseudomallei]|nr:polypeptide-transport-associated, ShlB-type domain protein [Burkholderia pseudomallei]
MTMILSLLADLRPVCVYCGGPHMTIVAYRRRLARYAYDRFAGTPVYEPSGFPTARVTVGFQVTAQF